MFYKICILPYLKTQIQNYTFLQWSVCTFRDPLIHSNFDSSLFPVVIGSTFFSRVEWVYRLISYILCVIFTVLNKKTNLLPVRYLIYLRLYKFNTRENLVTVSDLDTQLLWIISNEDLFNGFYIVNRHVQFSPEGFKQIMFLTSLTDFLVW